MDAIRAARHVPMPETPAKRFLPGSIEMNARGERLIHHEADRRTDIVCTWSRGNHLYRSSLTRWWYPAEHRSVDLPAR